MQIHKSHSFSPVMQKKYVWILLAFVVLLQGCLIISFQNISNFLSPSRLIALAVVESFIGLMVFSIFTGRLASLSITMWLLLLANFALTPVELKGKTPNLLALPPNLDYKLEISGDAMPGFVGVQHVTTDEMGFRTTKKIEYTKKGTALRIFTIGGSTTEEIYTDNSKTWSALLEANLAKRLGTEVEVINTGFAGLRAIHHLRMLEHISRYKPDAVVFLMGINDWNHHIKAAIQAQTAVAATPSPGSDKGGGNLQSVTQPTTPLAQKFDITRSLLWKSIQRFVGKELVIKNDGSYYYLQNHSVNRSDWRRLTLDNVADDYKEVVNTITALCKKLDVQCLFTNQPTAYQPEISTDLKNRLWMTPPNESYSIDFADIHRISKTYNRWLLEHLPKSSCDVSTALPPTTEYLIDDCHFNPKGSAVIADKISHCLSANLRLK